MPTSWLKTEFASLRPGVDFECNRSRTIRKTAGTYPDPLLLIWAWIFNVIFHTRKRSGTGTMWFISSIIEPVRERGYCAGSLAAPKRTFTCGYRNTAPTWKVNWAGPSARRRPPQKLATRENPAGDLSDTGSWRMTKMIDRYTDRLFGDILVRSPAMEVSWQALEQAILVAQKEKSALHGLHVIPSRSKWMTCGKGNPEPFQLALPGSRCDRAAWWSRKEISPANLRTCFAG